MSAAVSAPPRRPGGGRGREPGGRTSPRPGTEHGFYKQRTADTTPYLVTLSSGRWRGAVLVLLLVPADVLLLGGDGVRVDPHEVRHVAQHVDLILNVDAGFVLLVCGKFLIVLFLYDLQTGAVSAPPALVLGDAKLGKLDDGASTSSSALQLLHLVEERGGVLHE